MKLINKILFLTTLLLYLTVQGCCTSPSEGPKMAEGSPPLPQSLDNTARSMESKGAKSNQSPRDESSETNTAEDSTATPPENVDQSLSNRIVAVTAKYYYRHKGDTGFFEKLESNSQLFSGDHYAIKLTPKEDGYMYVYQVSGDNKVQDLMANSKRNNKKVAGNKTIVLPAERETFSLNDVTGLEEIYVLVFKQPNIMLEKQYNTLSNAAKINGGDKTALEDGQREMLKMLRETAKEKVSFKHDKKTNTKETQP